MSDATTWSGDTVTKDERKYRMEVYEMFRRRISEEDRLISERMIWMVFSEPMFFGGVSLVTKDESDLGFKLTVCLVLGVIGVAVAAITFFSVRAGQDEIGHLVRRYDEEFAGYSSDEKLIQLTARPDHHKRGQWLPNALPLFVIFLWSCLTAYFLMRAFMPLGH